MAVFSLRHYRSLFDEVCQTKFGRTYTFASLEKQLQHVRSGSRGLAARDVTKLFHPASTPFAHYWPQPNEKELDASLKGSRVMLGGDQLLDPRAAIDQLLNIFHNVGLASIVLRFVCPDRFGIFSTPVLHLLQLQRGQTIDLYLAYCQELKDWQEHFQLESVAETEMALWTYHEITNRLANDERAEQARNDFDNDVWIQRRRVGQILRPFLQRYGPLELARILAHENPMLAGKLAGEEYERLLRALAQRRYPGMELGEGWAKNVIDRLEGNNEITLEERAQLRMVWDLRNKAVHGASRIPAEKVTAEEIEAMVETIERLCVDWMIEPKKRVRRSASPHVTRARAGT